MNENTHIDQSKLEPQISDLINRSIDGELSAAEQAELDVLLDGSKRVRQAYEELKTTTGILDGAPEREPPEYLHKAIISQVRLPVPGAAKTSGSGLFSNWLSAPWARTGLAVAAGLVLTVSIYQTDTGSLSPEDASGMTGTIMKSPKGVLLDSTRFTVEAVNGKAELHLKDGLWLIDVNLESAGEVVLRLGFSAENFEYAGVNGLQNPGDSVVVENGVIKVSSSGQQHFELLLRRTAALPADDMTPLALEFLANNVVVHAAELDGSR